VVLEGVREIREEESDIITRFINFIDNAYFYKILLFITLDRAPEDIYKKGKRAEEFRRTISRLNEMNSKEYLITERRDEL
jgi:cell division protein ZapE